MQSFLFLLFSFLCLNLQGQKCPDKYDSAMSAGKTYLSKSDYDKALIEFQAAQIAARECGISTNEPADSLNQVFNYLKKQRNESVDAKRNAEKSEKKTKEALKKVELEKNRADSALKETENAKDEAQDALNKADKLIKAFYFYDGKFALALNRDTKIKA